MRNSRSSGGGSDTGQQFSRSTSGPAYIRDRECKRISRAFGDRNFCCHYEVDFAAVDQRSFSRFFSIRLMTSDLILAYSVSAPLVKSPGPCSNSTTKQNVRTKNRPNQKTPRRSAMSEE